MVKEVAVKKKMTKTELEEALIANFVNLQKVLTNLSIRFDELSSNITKLLQLFEISAKSFTEKYEQPGARGKSEEMDKDFLKKLDSLLDQNKTIAKGIMMMEEKIRERTNPSQPTQRSIAIRPTEDRFAGMNKSGSDRY
jgi:hypothetical protein